MGKQIVLDENAVTKILANALKEQLSNSGYSSPYREVVEEVVSEFDDEIRQVLKDTLKTVIEDKEFKSIVRQEFKHKVAKMLVGDLQGAVEKAVNSFRQDPVLKADMIKAIEAIIESSTPNQDSTNKKGGE